MSFRLIFETAGAGEHRYSSDRHASAEWRHGVVFDAKVYDDDAPALMDDFKRSGVFWGVHARLTLVVQPQQAERVHPRVEVYPGGDGKPARLDAFVHVPPSFLDAMAPGGQVLARLAFSQDWDAVSDYSAADQLGAHCAKLDAAKVTVQLLAARTGEGA